MKTYSAKKGEIDKKWVILDAAGKPLGCVAAKAASIIRGKHKPVYTPHVDTGDHVIIINAQKIKLTGGKWDKKIYYRHTGYPGGIKPMVAKLMHEKKPANMLKKAINGMLPKTRLGRTLRNHYRVYDTEAHPHAAQKPETVAF
ncbi:MAG: 50S ribosomal protein L13 [Nitrospinaceae bacterium]|nr:50S ribosomal protein L13 [Nitrospinaceae bacterium]NIS84089.1 50S ribosomal protein L13 [Nitrospinaceae bacterium]